MTRTRSFSFIAILVLIAGLTGCAVGPHYRRPAVDVPTAYRGTTAGAPKAEPQPDQDQAEPPKTASAAQSLGDEKWWEVFQDPQLQELIRTALKKNYDVRIAATRVLQAQAQLRITRADQLPSVSVGADIFHERSPQVGAVPKYEVTEGEVYGSASWNLDFWGKYRRATEASRATLLSYQWAQKQVMATLVADLATAYFQLRELDLELEISRSTLDKRRESLQLTQTLEQHGIDSLSDVREAEQLVYTAATKVTDLERQIAQQENAVSILLGNNPGDVPRGLTLTQQPHAPEVPAGIPSSLLTRRPDILQAEANLIAANARIGVARAAYFPSISLTGTAGFESSALTSLFTGPAGLWTLVGSVSQPIFQGGRLKANVRYAEAQHEQMLLAYQQTIQGAFKDVSNALIGYRKYREYRIQQEHLVESANDAARLSHIRFQAGTAAYLEVLTNETNAFSYELQLAQARGNELTSLVQLYQALGGGWR
jgi:outer membrane protein, multidrug efflux system